MISSDLFFRPDAHQGQVPHRLLRPPEAGAGEGVPLQPLHHHQAQGRARQQCRPLRATGEMRCREIGRFLEEETEVQCLRDRGMFLLPHDGPFLKEVCRIFGFLDPLSLQYATFLKHLHLGNFPSPESADVIQALPLT